MKRKVILIGLILVIIIFGSAVTYSFFHTSANISTTDQSIAKFIFESKEENNINLSLVNLTPGKIQNYLFSVYNSKNDLVSGVTIVYTLTIKTMHIMPLSIKLYKLDNDKEELVFTCDENYSTNTDNELVCNSSEFEMKYDVSKKDNYKLKVGFIDGYDSDLYSDLVDYIDISIKSSQKVGS